MPAPRNLQEELARLEAKQVELRERIRLIKENEITRAQLLAYCKKENVQRSDILWIYNQLPLMRITRQSRLKRLASGQKSKGQRPPPKPELIPIGARLRELRLAKGMSSVELGKRVGCHDSMITAYERGIWRIKPDRLAKLEKIFGKWLPVEKPAANEEK